MKRFFSALATAALVAMAGPARCQDVTLDNVAPGFSSTMGIGVPIMMYHGLNEEFGYNPAGFVDQMEYLAANGFESMTLDHLRSWILTGSPALPAKPVVLTFDDNYLSIYTVAYPVLGARGLVGYNYAHTQYVGVVTSYDHADWVEINEMESSGPILTESHTVSHSSLSSLGATALANELVNSKAAIETNMPGKVCRHLAYPYGHYNATVITAAQNAGYETAVTTIVGVNTRNTPLYELRRYAVYPDTPLATFQGYANAGLGGTPWTGSTSEAGYLGANYQYAAAGDGAAVATWTATLPASGGYQVSARWTAHSNRASNAPYTLTHDGGTTTVLMNQKVNGNQWVSLGTYQFTAGTPYTVSVSNNADGFVIADGVRFTALAGVDDWMLY